jgi:hypothetical protein
VLGPLRLDTTDDLLFRANEPLTPAGPETTGRKPPIAGLQRLDELRPAEGSNCKTGVLHQPTNRYVKPTMLGATAAIKITVHKLPTRTNQTPVVSCVAKALPTPAGSVVEAAPISKRSEPMMKSMNFLTFAGT